MTGTPIWPVNDAYPSTKSWTRTVRSLKRLLPQQCVTEEVEDSESDSTSEQPVLVRTYSGSRLSGTEGQSSGNITRLPPVSSYSFSSIMATVDDEEFRTAIDAIATLCAKSSLSLANAHDAHLPPLGEISAASQRPVLARRLTAVQETSSSSDGLSTQDDRTLVNTDISDDRRDQSLRR